MWRISPALAVVAAGDLPELRAERCGVLSFDQNVLPPSEWSELIYKPFIHWSRHGGRIPRTVRDLALLLRNALMRGRGHIEGSFYDIEYTAGHDIMAYFSHMISRTALGPVYSSWPLGVAFGRALRAFRAFAEAKGGPSCDCQEPDGFLTPALTLLKSMPPANWAVADWTAFLDFEDRRLREAMEKSCTFEAACADVQVVAHLLCAEHFLLLGQAARSLHKRGRAAAVALFAPFCHPALRAFGSVEDVVYNAALGITEANTKMGSAYLHLALAWRSVPARLMVKPTLAAPSFGAPRGPPRAQKQRFALFATLVETKDHYKEQNFVVDAMRLKCSAERLSADALPFHLIYGGGLLESELALLMRFGFIIEDYSREVDVIKAKCCSAACPDRYDGWATIFKLFAWRGVAYDLVLHIDMDACFSGRAPGNALKALHAENVTFLSDQSPSGPGWHSHIFALKPSLQMFKEVMDFTLTHPYCSEQDRLGDVFTTAEFAREGGMSRAVPHQPICEDFPINPYCLERTPERHGELANMDCEQFWDQCVDMPTALVSNVGSF